MPSRVYLIVFNPRSGAGGGESLAHELEARLVALGNRVTLRSTERQRNVFIERGDWDVVVVVGGDGTFHEAVNGIVDRRTPLAFLAAGTVNVLSAELGLPLDVDRFVRALVAGKTTPLSFLRVGGARFVVLFLEAGFIARVVKRVNDWRGRTDRHHGRFEFGASFLIEVFSSWGRSLRVKATSPSGEVLERGPYSNLLVTRTRRYADHGRVPIDPAIENPLVEPSFEVVGSRTRTPLGHMIVSGILVMGGLPRWESLLIRCGLLQRFRAERISFSGRGAEVIHADAESWSPPTPSVDVELAKEQLQLIVP